MTEYLWQTGYDWAIACRVVIEFKEGCSHQLVVTRNREEGLLWQGDKEKTLVLLWTTAVSRHIGVLGGLKVGPPPIGHYLLWKRELAITWTSIS